MFRCVVCINTSAYVVLPILLFVLHILHKHILYSLIEAFNQTISLQGINMHIDTNGATLSVGLTIIANYIDLRVVWSSQTMIDVELLHHHFI